MFSPVPALSRNVVFLLLALLTAAVFPVTALFAWGSLNDYMAARERLQVVEEIREAQRRRQVGFQSYQAFLDEVTGFMAAAREARILKDDVLNYDVTVNNRLVDSADLAGLLDSARSGERYIFRSGKMEITSLFAEKLLPGDLVARLNPAKNSQQSGPPLKAGDQVLLTLSGTYLVFKSR